MPDLTQQIRERLDAPRLIVEVPDTEPWTVEQIEAFRRELREQFGTGVRIVPLDPPSDTATPRQMRAALLAVLEGHKPVPGQGYDWQQDRIVTFQACATCGVPGEYGVPWPCPELLAIAKALGIEVDGG